MKKTIKISEAIHSGYSCRVEKSCGCVAEVELDEVDTSQLMIVSLRVLNSCGEHEDEELFTSFWEMNWEKAFGPFGGPNWGNYEE